MTPSHDNDGHCNCHPVVKKDIDIVKEDVRDLNATRPQLWAAINARLPNAIFYLFLSIMVPILGYIVISQYSMNERLIRIEERVRMMQEMEVNP